MVETFYSYDKLPNLVYDQVEEPLFFLGCNILSEYDENRIKIKEELNPKRFYHCQRFLYGISFSPSKEHLNLIEKLKETKNIDYFSYEKIISEFSLGCKENFAYLEDGVYPLDLMHTCDYIQDLKYENFFEDDEEMPIYQKIKGLNFLILIP